MRNRLPLLLKGPTGCGKTRFVEHMAARLGLPLFTVACHDDLSAADLIGRYLLKGGETVWIDGPLTRAVREGGICYLDEVVEARKDVTVVLHPLTDDRRRLSIDRTGEELGAPASLHARRELQPGLPEHPEEAEALDPAALRRDRLRLPRPGDRDRRRRRRERPRHAPGPARLVRLAGHVRGLSGMDLEEGVSTRLLVYAATLDRAAAWRSTARCRRPIVEPLSDEAEVQQALRDLAAAVYG